MRFAHCVLASFLLMSFAANAEGQQAPVSKRARSEYVLSMTPRKDLWESLGDGAIRHKRSGLVCAADALSDIILVQLSSLEGLDDDGNAACSYRSLQDQAKRVELFATRVPGGTTDSEFQRLREVVLKNNKGAESITPLRVVLIPQARGEAFSITGDDGKPVFSFLYTIAVGDWIVWSRVRYPAKTIDKKSAELDSLLLQATFMIAVAGVERTAQGIPEPRVTP